MIFAVTSQPPAKKPASIDPIWGYLGIGFVLLIALHFLSNRTKKGLLVTGKLANSGHQNKAKKQGAATIGKHSPTKAAYYIAEPIGQAHHGPLRETIKKAKVFLPQINRGVLVVGGPGSGKTASFINPALLSAIDQGFSIALFDFKFGAGGQSEEILPYALRREYKARIFAPGFDCSNVWNPLDQLRDENDLETAKELVSIMVANTVEVGGRRDPFFDGAAESIIAAAFLLAKSIAKKEGDPSMANLLMVSQILGMDSLGKRLKASESTVSPWAGIAASALTSSVSGEGKNVTEAGLLATATSKLSAMIMPRYLPAMCGKTSFPGFGEDVMAVDGKELIIFGVDKDQRASTLPIIATALQQVVSANLHRGRKEPMVIALDEFPTLNLKIALNWLNEDRSNGASLIIGCQYLGQLDARYTKDLAKGFRAGCATKIWFNPGEIETAEILSRTFGEIEVTRDAKSRSTNSGKGGTSRSVAEQLHKKALVEAKTIMGLPPGHCYIQSPGVGDNDEIGMPFFHKFRISNKASKEEEKNRELFAKLKVYYSGKSDSIDYGVEAKRYVGIIEKWLPLQKAGGQTINGSVLIDLAAQLGLEATIDPKKDYNLPEGIGEETKEGLKLLEHEMKFILYINDTGAI